MADNLTERGPTPTTDGPAQPELKRAIGPKLLLFFVIGDILGTGIYALTGDVAARIGGALWVPFLAAFIVAFLTAFSYLELVGKYPGAGGAALYTHRAFGVQFLTFMVTFTVMSSGVTSAASAAKAFGDTYLKQFATLPLWLVALVFMLGLALINFRGVGESVKANVLLTFIELGGLLLIIGVGGWAILGAFTTVVGALVAVDMAGAALFVHIPKGEGIFVKTNGWELVGVIAAGALLLAAYGAGRWSVDALLAGRKHARHITV